jgi:hypothetical protein
MWAEIGEKPLPAQVGPAVGLALGVTLLAELVALLIGHDHQADADTHGRENQDEDPALKGLNHARGGAGGLGVAERVQSGGDARLSTSKLGSTAVTITAIAAPSCRCQLPRTVFDASIVIARRAVAMSFGLTLKRWHGTNAVF